MMAALANKRRKDARAAAEECLALAPESALGHNATAIVALETRRWLDAEAACRRALAIDPEDATARHNLGVALANSKRRLEAIEHFTEASKLDPSDPTSRQQAVSTARSYVAGSGAALFVGLQAARIAGVETDSPVLASLVFGAVIVTFVVMFIRRRRRMADLSPAVAELVKTRRREDWQMGRATWTLAMLTSALVALIVFATPQIGIGIRLAVGVPALALTALCAWRLVVAIATVRGHVSQR
jgi:tetratricopeptide (TPR) repeat protein